MGVGHSVPVPNDQRPLLFQTVGWSEQKGDRAHATRSNVRRIPALISTGQRGLLARCFHYERKQRARIKTDLSLQMTRNKLGHFEHGNGFLAVENWLEFIVGVDLGSNLCILKFVLLDVVPEFFR